MSDNSNRFILYNNNAEFKYNKKKTDLDIRFNRIAFIFFLFFIISIIYTIHLIKLGSTKTNKLISNQSKIINKLHRANIIDRNGSFLAKTVSSIDIGINPVEIIDKKKLLLNLGYIFPNKDYESISNQIKKK